MYQFRVVVRYGEDYTVYETGIEKGYDTWTKAVAGTLEHVDTEIRDEEIHEITITVKKEIKS